MTCPRVQRATSLVASVRELAQIVGVSAADTHARRKWGCNGSVGFGDVTDMRTATIRVGAALALAAASIGVSQATANAEPTVHQVRYILTSPGNAADYKLNYLVAQPPSMEAYNADAYAYLKSEQVDLAPGAPWVFETTLEDPQWAIITASTGVHAMQAAPNPQCEIAVDGEVVVQNSGPYTANCQLGKW